MNMGHSFQGRTLFWPLLLIGVGVVWLFTNMGILRPANLGVLFRLWPLLLIGLGLNLLFGRRSPALSNLIGVGAVVVIIGLMLVGPSLGWAQGTEVKNTLYTEPLGDVEAAQVRLDLTVAETTVSALSDSNNLMEADLNYLGNIVYDVRGESQRTITLSEDDQFDNGFNFFNWGFFSEQDLRWNIGLNPDVPLDLSVSSGISSSNLDLSDLHLTRLNIDSGVGSMALNLPAMPDAYDVIINVGTGSLDIDMGEGAFLNMEISGGVGAVTVDVPDDAAVRIEASTGVGSIDVPGAYQQVSGDESDFVGKNGIWQSRNFDDAAEQIVIVYDGGVGSLTIR